MRLIDFVFGGGLIVMAFVFARESNGRVGNDVLLEYWSTGVLDEVLVIE
jgi:hypothetical protein